MGVNILQATKPSGGDGERYAALFTDTRPVELLQ